MSDFSSPEQSNAVSSSSSHAALPLSTNAASSLSQLTEDPLDRTEVITTITTHFLRNDPDSGRSSTSSTTSITISHGGKVRESRHDMNGAAAVESITIRFDRTDSGRSSITAIVTNPSHVKTELVGCLQDNQRPQEATDLGEASSLGGVSKSDISYDRTRKIKLEIMGFFARNLGRLAEVTVRLLIQEIPDFDKSFAKPLHITSLWEAVRIMGLLRGHALEKDEVNEACRKIADSLQETQGNLLLWYKRELLEDKSSTEKLISTINDNPWEISDVVSLDNVRKCLDSVPKNFKPTLVALAKKIDWQNIDLKHFTSPKGPGLYLAMFECFQKAGVSPKLMSFPPPGELQLDCQGRIQVEEGVVTIEVGEIKSSSQGISKACDQLERSITFLFWLHRQLDPSIVAKQYKGIGYIFLLDKPAESVLSEWPKMRKNIEFRLFYDYYSQN